MTYSFLDLAEEVLKSASAPMTYQQIWEEAKTKRLGHKVKTRGKTPWQTLGARLYVDVRDNPNSRFVKVGRRPARFFLKSRESDISDELLQRIEVEEAKTPPSKTSYRERDLHPLLAYFVYANPTFSKGRRIFTKTIFHEKSKHRGYNEWIHPDMVGVYFPMEDWNPKTIEFSKLLDNTAIRLFSFEIKRTLNKGNYRESFFQAVSNSSWAHEGYLVTADITQDDELLAELERLSASFGIGIIHLRLLDFDSSSVLFPARSRDILDWETVNKLCDQNRDFAKFIEDVKIDFNASRIHPSEYDKIIKDPMQYIIERLKITPAI